MSKILNYMNPGVLFGKDIQKIFNIAKKNNFAIPAINCINIDSINAVLEASSIAKSPIIIQLSYGGSKFISGYGIKNVSEIEKSVLGAISAAKYIHKISKIYGVPVILHTDHCNKKILPWLDRMLLEGKRYFLKKQTPLFSSHMIDLSQENIEFNIKKSKDYFIKMSEIEMSIEIELGCTGGEEDGVDNSNIEISKLYTHPKEVLYAYKNMKKINSNFTIAASFGNVHGVYKKGNIKLSPDILKKSQKIVSKKYNLQKNPVNFVFHGGSGSSVNEIKKSISYGVVKINIDTDIQWSIWHGILEYYNKYKPYLKSQLGNPQDKNSPNKKYYDPRVWIRKSQKSILKKMFFLFDIFNSINRL
ncbi:class II fructose-bisphosphate aldolase [Buchnera aphidicola (Taiwanaphis decaspermi)]|uniref:class II fructose-bisphosphate aldolase n=1 Tax=Buchnera aphidicola TaxID=9 RepID=UPI0031B8617C